MALEDDFMAALEKIGRIREPLVVEFLFGDFDDEAVGEIAAAMSNYHKACGGNGLELVELKPQELPGHTVRVYALCPAIPENES